MNRDPSTTKKTHGTAELSTSGMYPVILTQQAAALGDAPRRQCRLETRNISDKRSEDGFHAFIEVELFTFHRKRTDTASVSVVLTAEAARALIAELQRGLPND